MAVSIAQIVIAFLIMLGFFLFSMPIGAVMAGLGIIGGVMTFGWAIVESAGPVVWGTMNENILTAIPLFILLGELLLRSGVADNMYVALSAWLGRLPGGLLHTNIGCCALFAATSGSSVATAATIGTVALPALTERKYPMRQALGSIAAGGTLGILIPPSVNMLVYGSLTNNSIGRLFVAGIIPGVLLTFCFMAYLVIINLKDSQITLEKSLPLREKLALLVNLIPPVIVFTVVMGSIYFGIATPTESAAIGVMVALGFAWQAGKVNLEFFRKCFIQTARLSGMIMLIVVGAFVLNVTLSLLGAAEVLTKWVTHLGLSANGILFALMIFYIILGMFMDVLSMQVATIPIAYPIISHLGVDPIWFGIFIVLMCEVGMITPPVGMNLFVVQGVRRDGGGLNDLIWGAFPFVFIMLAFTVLMMYAPWLATWLPQKMYGA